MCSIEKRIRDIIHFYVNENYKNYLKVNNLTEIPEDSIPTVVDELYSHRKDNIQVFVKESLKVMLQDEMPEEYIINNLLSEIFRDDELCRNRLVMEISIHQQRVSNGTIDYKKI